MPMIAGSALANTGMAGAIYTEIATHAGSIGFNPAIPSAATAMQALVDAIAKGVVTYIQANAIATGVTAGAGVSGPIT